MNNFSNIEILLQDFKYCIKAFEKDNFNLMNIAANRLMENSIFLENEEIFLISAILKDMANDYEGIIAKNINILNSSKVIGKKMIAMIKANFNSEIDITKLWEEFQTFTENINEFHKDELESEVYSRNIEFTSITFKKILKLLEENKEILKKKHNTLFNGILGVMIRIMKNHSCTLKETMVYLYFKTFSLLYNYVLEKNYNQNEREIKEEDYKEYIEKHVNFIIKHYFNNNIDFKKFNSELWLIGKKYRQLYLLYNRPKTTITGIPIISSQKIIKTEKKNEEIN
ncbi:hypothetical protein LCGC14_0550040 [marine sediment metagenome]|uniref:Uncharacterized protein n=1 Tax=marine sediment metagenome TaxID=412755 RepID=A0A0F9S8N3_9ZZZZ